jgi:hypothetical protein
MRNSKVLLAGIIILSYVLPVYGGSSLCDAVAGNLVVNCGFESGSTSSTIDNYTNNNVPDLWVPNAAFDFYSGYNHLTGFANSGTDGLSIGDDDNEAVPVLSQTFSDNAGTTYNGSLYVAYGGAGDGDTNVFFNALIDGAPVVSLDDTASGNYTQYTFSFVGTGSDTLALQGNTNPSEWYVDDVTITGASLPSATPEPGSTLLLACAGGAFLLRRRLARQ